MYAPEDGVGTHILLREQCPRDVCVSNVTQYVNELVNDGDFLIEKWGTR